MYEGLNVLAPFDFQFFRMLYLKKQNNRWG